MNKSTQKRKEDLDKMSKEILTNKAKLSIAESIATLKAGQHLLNAFDEQMSEKNYTWSEVKEFINNTSDHIEKELDEQKADLKDKVKTVIHYWDFYKYLDNDVLDLDSLRLELKAEIAKVFE